MDKWFTSTGTYVCLKCNKKWKTGDLRASSYCRRCRAYFISAPACPKCGEEDKVEKKLSQSCHDCYDEVAEILLAKQS